MLYLLWNNFLENIYDVKFFVTNSNGNLYVNQGGGRKEGGSCRRREEENRRGHQIKGKSLVTVHPNVLLNQNTL